MTEVTGPKLNVQSAPWPAELADLVERCTYRPGWSVGLFDGDDRGQDCHGLTVEIMVTGQDTYPPHETIRVRHLFPVPAAAYNAESWRWWLFGCFLAVERHEAMEWFSVAGERPYAPNHGPGWDPYLVTVVAPEVARRTDFAGNVTEVAHYADHHDGLANLKPDRSAGISGLGGRR